MNGLYTIPLGVPFLPTLVDGLITETATDPLSLARYTVILPTRRGCLGLHQAFMAATPSRCRILPRIIALADIEEGTDLPGYITPQILPPAIPEWHRLGLLSQLVLTFETEKEGGVPNPPRAILLAQELIRLVDEVEIAGLDLSNLKNLVGADYAAHWQLTLDFLKILTDFWPQILDQKGYIEPAARRRMILEQVADHWKPSTPVILTGTTGTRPATVRFIQAVLGLEKGRVVLPGADPHLLQTDHVVVPTHPQYTLSKLIQQVGTPELWPSCPPVPPAKNFFISKAMAVMPEEDWCISPEITQEIQSSFQAIEASSALEEAQQIALIMRYELETPDQTIALLTPDLNLSRQVQAALGRWGLSANVAGGTPLPQSVVGRFLLLSSRLTQQICGADLLALLKHPLYAKGHDRLAHLTQTREFEREVLRGFSHTHIHHLSFPGYEMCQPLLKLRDGRPHSLRTFLDAHKTTMEALVGDETLLWGQEDGHAAATFWENLTDHADSFPPFMAQDYPAFLHSLMAQEIVQVGEGIGSRLLILGPREARFVQADVIILGGLNEGTWPGTPEDDPWLSRSMRESFGLPPLDQKIGLSAHDFCMALTAPKVYLTRALKQGGAPTLPSRWWQRFKALLATGGETLSSAHPWNLWSRQLDEPPHKTPFLPPEPCPPLFARPKRLSVTDVEKLIRDPYSIYAKTILKLRPLDPLDADMSVMERGQAIHHVLDAFVKSGTDPASPEAITTFETLGREAFGPLLADPRAKAFWWPRFQRLGKWFLTQMATDGNIHDIKTEMEGSLEIPTTHGPIILKTKADRIDVLASGQTRIIDYKTGTPPTKKDVQQGYSPQLPLEGLILKKEGFPGISSLPIAQFSYWHLKGGIPAGEIISFEKPAEMIEAAEQGVHRLFEAFFGQETPFHACPDPRLPLDYSDYAHLERLKEWG